VSIVRADRPRIAAVVGIARALLETLEIEDAVDVLVAEFGWDLAFQALALLHGPVASDAFGAAWEMLILGPVREDIDRPIP
jgi:hypothetical protein